MLKVMSYGGILLRQGSNGLEILLREPTNHYGGYAWTFAKGRSDLGETPEECALREVLEETGYKASITGLLPGFYPGSTTFTQFFLMKPLGNPGPHDNETNAVQWVDLDQAETLISQTLNEEGRLRDLRVLSALKALKL